LAGGLNLRSWQIGKLMNRSYQSNFSLTNSEALPNRKNRFALANTSRETCGQIPQKDFPPWPKQNTLGNKLLTQIAQQRQRGNLRAVFFIGIEAFPAMRPCLIQKLTFFLSVGNLALIACRFMPIAHDFFQ